MRFRYTAQELEMNENISGFIYVPKRKKYKMNKEFKGFVEADSIEEANKIATRAIRKFAPNCKLVNMYEVKHET